MKTRTFNLQTILQVLFILAFWPLQGQWTIAHLSEAREHPYAVVTGPYVLFVTGSVPTIDGGSNKVDIYNAETGTWLTDSLPFTTDNLNPNPTVATLGGKVYFINDRSLTEDVYVYDPAAKTWSTMLLSEAREHISVGVAGDYVVFAGGRRYNGELSGTVDLYHVPSDTWHVSQLSEPRAYMAITGLGNKIFLAGGFLNTDLSDNVDIIDTDSWTVSSSTLVEKRGLIEAVTVGDKVLLAGGGLYDFIFYNQVDVYDGASGTWSAHYLTQYDFTGILRSAVVGNQVYFQGGDGPKVLEMYDAETGDWTTFGMPTQHALGAFTSSGNFLYTAGGVNDYHGVVERFDCSTGVWDTLGFLSEPRNRLIGAIVSNQLLFAGGYGDGYSSTVDIYTGIASRMSIPTAAILLEPYPNPTSGMLYIPLPADATMLRVFDIQGKLTMTSAVDNIAVKEIFTGNLSPGFYLISVEGTERVYWAKFEVQ